MQLRLSLDEVKQAVVEYVTKHKLVTVPINIEDVTIAEHTEGDYDTRENIFDGINIDIKPEKISG
jgi:hypothetical protein